MPLDRRRGQSIQRSPLSTDPTTAELAGRAGRKRRRRGRVDTTYVKRHDPTTPATGLDRVHEYNKEANGGAYSEATPEYVTEQKQKLLLSATWLAGCVGGRQT